MLKLGLFTIPYDRNLYLTVTSPEGQDKELLPSKALNKHIHDKYVIIQKI